MGQGVRRATSRHEEKATTKYIQVRICGGIAAQCASPGEKCDHVEQNCTRGEMRLLRHPRMRVLRHTSTAAPTAAMVATGRCRHAAQRVCTCARREWVTRGRCRHAAQVGFHELVRTHLPQAHAADALHVSKHASQSALKTCTRRHTQTVTGCAMRRVFIRGCGPVCLSTTAEPP